MRKLLRTLVRKLEEPTLSAAQVIPWSSPVPVFGNFKTAKVATLGINPSNREFVDNLGNELDGKSRRFHTLRSLGLPTWAKAKDRHIQLIDDSCTDYFQRNPYDAWFRKLDSIIVGTNTSYYHSLSHACHLDLVPYATGCKWTALTAVQRSVLLESALDTLGSVLRASSVRLLILNGGAVVKAFERVSETQLAKQEMPSWTLQRSTGPDVIGHSYFGVVSKVGGIDLGRTLFMAGFNYNLQSSFGVSKTALSGIRDWVTGIAAKALQ
jgi:hypothetical protein